MDLLPLCDGCGASFTVEHALDCHVGGLVRQHHNEVQDAVGDLASLAWDQVTREPVVCESFNNSSVVTLIANLQVLGVWQSHLPDYYIIQTAHCCIIITQGSQNRIYSHVTYLHHIAYVLFPTSPLFKHL